MATWSNGTTGERWVLGAAVALVAVLGLDLVTDASYAAGLLYLPVVVLASLPGRTRPVVLTVVGAMLLTVVGGFLTPDHHVTELTGVLVDRTLVTFALLATGAVTLMLVRTRQRLERRTTELTTARAALDGQHELLALAAEVGHFGGWSVDLVADRVTWSDEVARIHRRPPGFAPSSVDEGLAAYLPEHRPRLRQVLEDCAGQGKPFEEEAELVPDDDGAPIWVHVSGRAVRGPDGTVVRMTGAFQDVSDRRAAQHAAEQSAAEAHRLAERLTATWESIGDGVLVLDRDWQVTMVNRHAEHLLHRERSELLGRNLWTQFPVDVCEEFEEQLLHASSAAVSTRFEAWSPALEIWLEVSAYPFEEGIAVYFRDITRTRSLAERLAHAERLESLGRLTGGVAHDFNNLLTVVLGNAEVLVRRLGPDHPSVRLAENISEAARRGADLTRSLLAIARRQPLHPELVDVNALVSGTTELLGRTLGSEITLVTAAGAEHPTCHVDRVQLENAVLNLCLNARDAMPLGGTLTLTTSSLRLDEIDVAQLDGLEPGHYVAITVRDEGTGIADDVLERVFEPFFTTKDDGRGSGLGLAMVYGFVKQSAGDVTVTSRLGIGTSITLYLPVADSTVLDLVGSGGRP